MKFFKKAREAFERMTGGNVQVNDAPPPIRPEPTPQPEPEIQDPRFKYRRAQRDFERRAAETTPVYDLGATYKAGRNVAKRAGRALLIARGASPRVAKRKQLIRASDFSV